MAIEKPANFFAGFYPVHSLCALCLRFDLILLKIILAVPRFQNTCLKGFGGFPGKTGTDTPT